MMVLLEEWGLESEKKKKQLQLEADAQDQQRRAEESAARYAARLDAKAKNDAIVREEDEKQTQEVMEIMRRAGVVAGVNAPEADEETTQLETNKEVYLHNRPAEEIATGESGSQRRYLRITALAMAPTTATATATATATIDHTIQHPSSTLLSIFSASRSPLHVVYSRLAAV